MYTVTFERIKHGKRNKNRGKRKYFTITFETLSDIVKYWVKASNNFTGWCSVYPINMHKVLTRDEYTKFSNMIDSAIARVCKSEQ